jgi:hypothetical protein
MIHAQAGRLRVLFRLPGVDPRPFTKFAILIRYATYHLPLESFRQEVQFTGTGRGAYELLRITYAAESTVTSSTSKRARFRHVHSWMT